METESWTTERLLTTAARLTENAWNERLTAIGITHASFVTLRALETLGPVSQVQLSNQLRVTAQTIGKTLGRLEQQGLVSRTASAEDRRTVLVSLSGLGRERLAEAEQGEREFTSDLHRATPELRALLVRLITDLLPGTTTPRKPEST